VKSKALPYVLALNPSTAICFFCNGLGMKIRYVHTKALLESDTRDHGNG